MIKKGTSQQRNPFLISQFIRKGVYAVYGRLNKSELELTIKLMIEYANSYIPLIMEYAHPAEGGGDFPEQTWIDKSVIHKECRSRQWNRKQSQ